MQIGIFSIQLRERQLFSECDLFCIFSFVIGCLLLFFYRCFVQVGLSEAEAAEMVSEADQEGVGSVGSEAYFAIMKNAGWF